MAAITGERPDPRRLVLLRSCFESASLDEVAAAVAVATEHERHIYVERLSGGLRWSLTHPGGSYPLLRITARFLQCEHTRIMIPFRAVSDCVFVLTADPNDVREPDAWTVLDFDGPTDAELVRERIAAALA